MQQQRPTGVIPPMTTPFRQNGDMDLSKVAAQVKWLIDAGAHGLAAGGSTGEGHTLDHEEYRDLLAATVEATQGRIPVIAGIIVNSTRDAIKRGKLVANMNVAALQVTPVHYLFKPDDEAMVDHFRAMADATGMPIIIYNVVPWSYLSPKLLTRIMQEVPLVVGVKQSAGDLKLFADLMLMAPDKLIYSAVDALLYPSYTLGAHAVRSPQSWQRRRTLPLRFGMPSKPTTMSAHSSCIKIFSCFGTPSSPTICRPAQGMPSCCRDCRRPIRVRPCRQHPRRSRRP